VTNKIHPSLKSMATDVFSLSPLEGNPRVGNVEAIMASYSEFGQVKPIVATKNADGTATVIAGNHQLEAAKALGWDEIAVVFLDADDKRATAFAIADNRTMELGYTDPELLLDMLIDINDYYPELLEGLEWDEFEIASMESEQIKTDAQDEANEKQTEKYNSLETEDEEVVKKTEYVVQEDGDGERRIIADPKLDQQDIAVRGSTVASPGSAPQAAVQYTIVFDGVDQQSRWYDFVRWLRSNPSIDGNTTAEKLMNFIGEHCEI
jgi:ParB-like chromosome segregation protein Spo0J